MERSVCMVHEPGSMLRLTICDNGIGLPAHWADNKKRSMGMNLMQALANQLHGSFDLVSKNGLSITVEFPYGADASDPRSIISATYTTSA